MPNPKVLRRRVRAIECETIYLPIRRAHPSQLPKERPSRLAKAMEAGRVVDDVLRALLPWTGKTFPGFQRAACELTGMSSYRSIQVVRAGSRGRGPSVAVQQRLLAALEARHADDAWLLERFREQVRVATAAAEERRERRIRQLRVYSARRGDGP